MCSIFKTKYTRFSSNTSITFLKWILHKGYRCVRRKPLYFVLGNNHLRALYMNDCCFCCLQNWPQPRGWPYFPMVGQIELHYLQICVRWTYCCDEWTSCLLHQRNTAHTLPHCLFCPNNNSSVTREGVHANSRCCFFFFFFVSECYQSELETTVNAHCLVSVLFSRSRFHCLNTFPTIIHVATNLLLQIHKVLPYFVRTFAR
jgi:hypothetical protein